MQYYGHINMYHIMGFSTIIFLTLCKSRTRRKLIYISDLKNLHGKLKNTPDIKYLNIF